MSNMNVRTPSMEEDLWADWKTEPNYMVVNENCIGWTRAEDFSQPFYMSVMHGSALRGGPDWRDGEVIVTPRDNPRRATAADFIAYNLNLPSNYR